MTIKRFNISKLEKYTGWHNVGTMTVFQKDDGSVSRIVEIPAIGLKANIFEQKPKEPVAPAAPAPEEPNPDDIPF